MSTIHNPVHVPVDTMEIANGPSKESLLTLPRWEDCYDIKTCSIRMTLTTSASQHPFTRKMCITDVVTEYEGFTPDNIFEPPTPTGKYHVKGFLGDWYFTGTYNPQTRKGTLHVVAPLTPEEEMRRDIEDVASEHALALWEFTGGAR